MRLLVCFTVAIFWISFTFDLGVHFGNFNHLDIADRLAHDICQLADGYIDLSRLQAREWPLSLFEEMGWFGWVLPIQF